MTPGPECDLCDLYTDLYGGGESPSLCRGHPVTPGPESSQTLSVHVDQGGSQGAGRELHLVKTLGGAERRCAHQSAYTEERVK